MPTHTFTWEGDAKHVTVTWTTSLSPDSTEDVVTEMFKSEDGRTWQTAVTYTAADKLYYFFTADGQKKLSGGGPIMKRKIDSQQTFFNVVELAPQPPRPYTYKPLDFDTYEIRLLRLDLSKSNSTDMIVCSMDHVSLINPGPYIALSYCWGAPDFSYGLMIGDRVIKITSNLFAAFSALISFKRKEAKEPVMSVWIDAVCINQQDPLERSDQVRSMRQIYSRAEGVVAWAGTPRDQAAAQSLSFLKDYKYRLAPKRVSTAVTVAPAAQIAVRLHSPTMDEFLGQPYWKRVWVIQEITVASQVTVLYGHLKVSWEDVAAYFEDMELTGSEVLKEGPTHMLKFRNRFFMNRTPPSLVEALYISRGALATDLRDKIYALLGLCHDGAMFVPLPNYIQPLSSIIADMSKSMMLYTKSLNMILLRGTGKSILEHNGTPLPSWAPDLPRIWSGGLTVLEEWLLDRMLSPSTKPSLSPPILPGSTNTHLVVQGHLIGTVNGLTSAIGPHSDPSFRDKYNIKPEDRNSWIHKTSSLVTFCSANRFEFRGQLWRTLAMTGLKPGLWGLGIDDIEDCLASLWRPEGRGLIYDINFIEWVDRNAWFKLGPTLDGDRHITLREHSQHVTASDASIRKKRGFLGSSLRSIFEEERASAKLRAGIGRLQKIIGSGMRLAALESQHHSCSIAMVHPDTQEGDQIYVVAGCSAPVILRLDANMTHKVVGAAYLDKCDDFDKWRVDNGSMMETLTLS